MKRKTYALIILDGYGERAESADNAIRLDGSKYISEYRKEYPSTLIQASGMDVGLPEGQMGNSEVGHLNIGAGRIVYQELTRITKAIDDGDFFENEAFLRAMNHVKEKKSKLHVMGLCSDGGVHSHLNHLYALLRMAKQQHIEQVYIHCFMDGRDTPPNSGIEYIRQIEAEIAKEGMGKIATISGRYYAMDRDNRWDRVEKAYQAIVDGEGAEAASAEEAMIHSYDANVFDEFVIPTVIMDKGKPSATIDHDDSVIFFNFRPDRARELTRAFQDPKFEGFERKKGMLRLMYVTFTQYDATFANIGVNMAYSPQTLDHTLGAYLADLGKTQFHIAETEKYAHVTFFFNGGVEEPYQGEDRCLVPSPKVATYDLQPEMSANEVADKAVEAIESGKYDIMILNFANPDMVGHTGNLEAAEKAIHAVDACAHRVIEAIRANGGECLVTADHGNSETMVDPVSGEPFTAHTTNPVPLIYINDADKSAKLRADGRLADLAPTLLTMMGLPVPAEMTGKTLIEH